MMDIEAGFRATKSCGRFQILLLIMATYIVLTTGYNGLFSAFIFNNPSWQCTENSTRALCIKTNGKIFSSGDKEFERRCMFNRSEWTYTTIKKHSAVTEFDLVCDKTTLAATSSSALYVGGLFGAVIAGRCADTYGRKPVLLTSLLSGTLISIGCAFVQNIWELTALRCLLGACYASYFTITLVYLMEFIAPKNRTKAGILFSLAFCFSLFCVDIFAYHQKTWRSLQLYMSFPPIIALFIIVALPESPRWLYATGKTTKAQHNLKSIGRFNGVRLSEPTLQPCERSSKKVYTYYHLFRYKHVALVTLSQACLWMTSAAIYYALGLESANLGGDMYHVFAYLSLAEIPSNIVAIPLCDRLGRKKTILGSMVLSGIMTGLISIQSKLSITIRSLYSLSLAVVARFLITISYNCSYVWAFEVFPTVVRSKGLCICTIIERLGGIMAPYLVRVLQRVNSILPYLIMCCLAISTALLGLVQPETIKKPTREQFEDFFEKNEVHSTRRNENQS